MSNFDDELKQFLGHKNLEESAFKVAEVMFAHFKAMQRAGFEKEEALYLATEMMKMIFGSVLLRRKDGTK